MSDLFCHCEELNDIIDLANWNAPRVENIREMFRSCEQQQDTPVLSDWDVSELNDMKSMFH
jgi:hypothetical protein